MMAAHLILLCPLLFLSFCSSASANSKCQFSIPNNDTLFQKLSKHFDKNSNTIVIEYTIRLNNGSGEFKLYKGSNSNSFEPWKWYRTQGTGNSHILLTYDFYFGILKRILALGTRQFDINIAVQPLSCVESENFDLSIRDILLQDFKISGNSTYRAYPKADDVEVCTARIEETHDGRAELMFRCCSYDSEKKIFCDDKSVNLWGYALNILIIIIAVFLVCCFLWVVQREHEEEIYCYSPPASFTFDVQLAKKEPNETKEHVHVIPAETWHRMKNFKQFVGDNVKVKGDIYTVSAESVHFRVWPHLLYNISDEVRSLREMLKTLFKKNEDTESTDSLTRKIKAKISECPDRVKQCVKNFATMAILTLPSLLFLCTMLMDRFWYQELIEAYVERGLHGPFYFQWSNVIKIQRALVWCLLVWYLFGFVLYTIFGDRMRRAIMQFIRSKNKSRHQAGKKCNEKNLWLILTLFFFIPFFIFLFLGVHFILNLVVMMIFTVIVQSDIFSIFIQAILTFVIYVEVYYKDYHKHHNALKTVLLNLLTDEGEYDSQRNGMSEITANVFETKFKNRKIDTPLEKVDAKSSTFSVQDGNLTLKLNAPVLFLNNYDVRSISRTFLFHCCQIDCEGAPKAIDIPKMSILLTATVTFIALVFLIVKAFGDIYYISPSNSFIFSFVTSLAPLVLSYFNTNLWSENMVHKNDRRFQDEILNKFKDFRETIIIQDMELSFPPQNENRDGDWKEDKGKQSKAKETNTGQGANGSKLLLVLVDEGSSKSDSHIEGWTGDKMAQGNADTGCVSVELGERQGGEKTKYNKDGEEKEISQSRGADEEDHVNAPKQGSDCEA
ncbi:unnamed protein product [Lymnaea stagnalis]|uniref:Uncharacterized protein n=1 Tax=Lymnaea stagnalis TaxID=6523 RepID=A0AAV2GZT8_LYMST